ncbi:NERD domain-containing protein [Variovorax sp. PAMC28562]|uniref:DEAD/DEAH box helicase n=1 Tax=Variovorax sp. PAMC28562 TaxID=2762323 RepID=UPI00164D6201|nr:3'-5' exonuclease [Variovorax sp. PAMC28562]QNK74628.1 NERD domain-containing protein [Variovorax sp. PAMC28562]
MSTLIPALNTCVSRMTTGERRLAERLEQKLGSNYLVWYDVPVGPKRLHPDFIVLHPRRGLLVLEVKDWKLDDIRQAGKLSFEVAPEGVPRSVINPLEQARQYAHQMVAALTQDPQLVQDEGKWRGMLSFPWSYGLVLTHITRRQFVTAELDCVIDSQRVICSDEMTETVDPQTLKSRLWNMFPALMHGMLSIPNIDRVRWILFPEVRVDADADMQVSLDIPLDLPDTMTVLDIQQERLSRSLGDGHRVIHGVAGSGKTLILARRAVQLAKRVTTKPVLVLCYNEPLAVQLASVIASKGLAGKVHVRHFHKWCREQLVSYGQALPVSTETEKLSTAKLMEAFVQRLVRAVDKKQVPSGQYMAVLIDEGHDFKHEWLKLVVQMVDPDTNSLLLLYDDAQSIYERHRTRKFSFRSVGIHAQGRTSMLKVNYRNTKQILDTASRIAGTLLMADKSDNGSGDEDDGIPLLHPVSSGRVGQEPTVVRMPNLQAEALKIAELLSAAHFEGHAWGDMAVICRHHTVMDECAKVLEERMLPHQVRKGLGTFDPEADTIKVMSMHASKGLEFGVVALMGVEEVVGNAVADPDEARLFYVAATRARSKLLITASNSKPAQPVAA